MSAKQKIYDHFHSQIVSGEISTGEKLPTEEEIAQLFNVSRSTVQAVMARLSHEGIVERQAGRGTFACDITANGRIRINLDIHNIQSFENEIAIIGDKVSYKLVSFSKTNAPQRVAKKLEVGPDESVFSLHRVRYVGEECIGSELRFFSPEIDLDVSTRSLERKGAHAIIEEDLEIRIGRIEATLRAISAPEDEARLIGVENNAPLLVRAHTLFTEDNQVILYGESYYVQPFSFRYTADIRA